MFREIPGFYYDEHLNRYFPLNKKPRLSKLVDIKSQEQPISSRISGITREWLHKREISTLTPMAEFCISNSQYQNAYPVKCNRFSPRIPIAADQNVVHVLSDENVLYKCAIDENSFEITDIQTIYSFGINPISDITQYQVINGKLFLCSTFPDLPSLNSDSIYTIKFDNHRNSIDWLNFSNFREFILYGNSNGCGYHSSSTGTLRRFFKYKSGILDAFMDETQNLMLAGCRNGDFVAWDTRTNGRTTIFNMSGNGAISKIHMIPNEISSSSFPIALRMNGNVDMFDLRFIHDSKPIHSFCGHKNTHLKLGSLVDFKTNSLLIAGNDNVIRFWNIQESFSSRSSWPYHELSLRKFSGSSEHFSDLLIFQTGNAKALLVGGSDQLLSMC